VAGNSATIGAQNGTGNFQAFGTCNTAQLTDGEIVSFTCAPTSAPTCSLSLSPATGAGLDSFSARCTVTPGSPASPPYTVTLDASQVGAGTVTLFDDGPGGGHGDAVAGDLTYTNNVTVASGTSNGAKTLTSSVVDSALPTHNTSSCSAVYTVNTVALAGT